MVLKKIHRDDSIAEKEVEDIRSSLDSDVKEKMTDTFKYLLKWTVMKRYINHITFPCQPVNTPLEL